MIRGFFDGLLIRGPFHSKATEPRISDIEVWRERERKRERLSRWIYIERDRQREREREREKERGNTISDIEVLHFKPLAKRVDIRTVRSI